VASLAGQQLLEHPTSTGRAAITLDIEIRDGDGNPVPEGEMGEVHVRSPYLMLGYWNDTAATSPVLKPGGWLAMGDLGRMRDRLLYIETRARDMILVNAENVSPTEVEHRLEAHPDVLEAAVFAVDDMDTGDAVCAVVVANHDVRTDVLVEWCRTALAHYKVPTRWHVVGKPLPRTPSGKLVKDDIRALVAAPEKDRS
jgi:acyl-CoA synthetase (AMP-forming)/AMP-acid ligase II